jgi:hypothetical protein
MMALYLLTKLIGKIEWINTLKNVAQQNVKVDHFDQAMDKIEEAREKLFEISQVKIGLLRTLAVHFLIFILILFHSLFSLAKRNKEIKKI